MKSSRSAACIVVLVLTVAVSQTLLAQSEPADLVLVGGDVVTLAADPGQAEAVAVRDGRIVAVGEPAEIEALTGPETEVIDLDGRMLLPGFIEGHGHFLGLGEALMTLDLQDTRSFAEVVSRVEQAVADAEPGEWITGRGWHQENWNETGEDVVDGVPTHHELSAVSPDNPVLLTHASGHAALANEMALGLAGIAERTPNPEGGEIVRDGEGQPTGFLRQAAQQPVRERMRIWYQGLGQIARQQRFQRQVDLAAEQALSHGVTSFHDMGQRFDDIDRLLAMDEEGALPLRLYVAVIGETNTDLDRRLPDYLRPPADGRMLAVRSVKRHLDGALGTHGAWLLRPYADRPDHSGLPQMSLADLRETAAIAYQHGFQLNTHAIGDRANREALSVYESIQRLAGDEALRWRIEHAQTLHPDDVPRFAELDVIASMQGIHATSDGPWVPQRLGEERAEREAYVWRSLLDSGATICNGTDVPVEPISPIASLHASITREMANGERFFPEQSMERVEALKSYTIHCAFAAFEEERLGTIEVGKLADLVVLDRNLLEVSEDELAEARVDLTLVGGEVRYRRENSE
ncbi:amidohydrolase [Wenzhouxiangella limi]|uniref:Amidohydrolase n=1 Tax=Wenzhouxiangella limi TaxID=2707351 RepID=A0A845V9M5_9GAMM|nr:amidohydrolase [Wenzhouxiangella limi]NDY96841.1 amidohydrolase [Wenzhouxiangella limi]